MRRSIFRFLRVIAPGLLALAAAGADAGTAVASAAAYVGPAYGAHWAGRGYYRPYYHPYYRAYYRPYYRPWVGAGWGYRYPGYGYPGWGWGWGWGYGAGWAIATSPAWGYPAPYVMPSWVPQGVTTPEPPVEQSAVSPPAAADAPQAPQAPQAAAEQPGYWYYCTDPAGYHPYVKECSRPWIAVQPVAK